MNIESLLKKELASYGLNEWVGEVGGEEVTLYAKPLSPADNARVTRKFPNFNNTMEFAGMVEYIVIKAVDSEGNKVFSEKTKPLLMRLNQTKVGEIFNALFADQLDENESDHEDKVGNS